MERSNLTLGISLVLLLSGTASGDETRHLKCTLSGTFADGVETNIDTNGDGASATLDQGVFKCNGLSGNFQEESEWIPQKTVTTCPDVLGMLEFHLGQNRVINTDSQNGDQIFQQNTSGTECFNQNTGLFTTKLQGLYFGGTGKYTGATGNVTAQASGSYLQFGCKGGVSPCGGFGQFTGTSEVTLTLPKGNGH